MTQRIEDQGRHRVFLGFSANEMRATNVAEASLRTICQTMPSVRRISRLSLWRTYHRPTEQRDGKYFDVISDAPMSTDHAIARFWVPFLCDYQGWALFTDGDVLFRKDIAQLFKYADPRYAVMCVQHPTTTGTTASTKKAGDVQTRYPRKNWSSVMLFNCGHGANRALTLDYLNTQPGRKLHAFSWLADAEVGPLPIEWNYLVGEEGQPPVESPAIVHYTLGTPDLPGYEQSPYAEEWRYAAKLAGYAL